MRKIIHVDMDAFYASVEQRDNPVLGGKPVVVAWKASRSVVCAASYEARAFGVRSAMPAVRAQRLCPEAIFVPPDFTRYRAGSHDVRDIFKRYTDLIEPVITENSVHARPASLRVVASLRRAARVMVLAIAPGLIGVGVRDLLRREWPTGGTFAFRPKRNVGCKACSSGHYAALRWYRWCKPPT